MTDETSKTTPRRRAPIAGEAAKPVKKAAAPKASTAKPAAAKKPVVKTVKKTVTKPAAAAAGKVRAEAARLTGEATGKAKGYAEQGKERASEALDTVAKLVSDAAVQVDERVGDQYGRYARVASEAISDFASNLRKKDVDQLLGDARDVVRKSPAIAIGAAAAIGFVIARLVKAGGSDKSA
jgi:ElaB/YqjD/DUF883 family membrane-anchored ribosome-binding protein